MLRAGLNLTTYGLREKRLDLSPRGVRYNSRESATGICRNNVKFKKGPKTNWGESGGGEDGKMVSYGIRPNFEYSMSHSDLSKRMGSPYSHYRKQIFSGLNITIKVLYPKHSFFTSN